MALTEVTSSTKSEKLEKKNSDAEKKTSEGNKCNEKKEKPLTKVIVRRLPPSIDQETFLNQVSPVPDYDYIYTVKGDASLGEFSFARVYINFTNPADVYNFKEKFDNYVFLDNRGHEYPAVVEFAAFPKIPKKRNKNRVDPKCGTIETDPAYLEFVEMINKPPELDKAEFSYQIPEGNENSKLDATTPLLEYIKNKRAERLRIREERREERKRKESERRKVRDDERKRRYEEKSPTAGKSHSSKVSDAKESKPEVEVEKTEKENAEKGQVPSGTASSSFYKQRDRKFDERKKEIKSKYASKKDFIERREFKSRRDDYKDRDYKEREYKERDYKDREYRDRDYKSKHDDYKKESENKTVKKVKKYSEKREERKFEALKAEKIKLDEAASALEEKSSKDSRDSSDKGKPAGDSENRKDKERDGKPVDKHRKDKEAEKSSETESTTSVENSESNYKGRDKDFDEKSQKRIRNKDRPTLAIYRPGMLSKRKQTDGDVKSESETKDSKKDSP